MKLQSKLIALITLYILVFVTITTVYFTRSQKNIAVKNLEDRAMAFLKIMSVSSSTQVFWNNFDKLNQYTQKIKENLAVKYVMITDKNGVIVAHSDRWRIGQKVIFPEDFNVLKSEGILKKYIHSVESTFTASYPIKVIDQIVGYVVLQYSLDSIEAEFRGISQRGFGLAALLGIIGVLIALSTAFRITRPINQVMEGMERIRKDEYDVKINVASGAKEFRTLAQAFNNMGSKLKFTIRKLDQERVRSEAIVNSITDGLMIIDKDQKIGFFNKGAEYILGFSQNEALGKKRSDIFKNAEYLDASLPPLLDESGDMFHIHQDGEIQNQKISLSAKDGKNLVILISAAPLIDSRGEVYGKVEVFKDITNLLAMENKLKESDRLASLGVLAAGMAHEINNPIMGIIGLSSSILKQNKSDSIFMEDMTMIKEQGERCGRIIKNLMNMSLNAPKTVVPVDINTLLNGTMRILSKSSPDVKMTFIEDLDPSNPVVSGDETQIIQVFTNIMRNAITATNAQGMLKVSTKVTGSKLEIAFIDDGEGIAPVNINRVCDPFFTTKKIGEGMGLGLAVSYGIIKNHGGDLKIESELGKGTCFIITFDCITQYESTERYDKRLYAGKDR